MTATLIMDEAGQITLSGAVKRAFGVAPGVQFRAEVTKGRLQMVPDESLPEITEGVMENGVLVLPHFGFPVDVAAAVRAERDELAERAARR
ncbi:MAG: hypothetical protein ACO1TE_01310 [Prosthecobacter sp.]